MDVEQSDRGDERRNQGQVTASAAARGEFHQGESLKPDDAVESLAVTVSAANHDLLTVTQAVQPDMQPALFRLQPTGLPPHEPAPIAGKVEFVVSVKDAVNKDQPVPNAKVTLFDKNQLGLAFEANDYGGFDTFLVRGDYRYRAEAAGYQTKEEAFTAAGELQPGTQFYLHNFTIYLQPTGSKPPAAASKFPALTDAELQLQGLTRTIGLPLAPGAKLRLFVTLSSANPYVASVGEVSRGVVDLVAERTEPVARTGGRPLLGAPTERRLLEFRVGERAEGTGRIVVELRRPWEQKADTVYTVAIQVVKDGAGMTWVQLVAHHEGDVALTWIYCNAFDAGWHVERHKHGDLVCMSGRAHPTCYDYNLPILAKANDDQKWGLNEAQLRIAVRAWGTFCGMDVPGQTPNLVCEHWWPKSSHP